MDTNIEKFIMDIDEIHESDYGDFMRKANNYILKLRRRMRNFHDQDIDHKIDEMQDYVQFHPSWEVEATREKVLHDANTLDQILEEHDREGGTLH
jgi:hypothetical protein